VRAHGDVTAEPPDAELAPSTAVAAPEKPAGKRKKKKISFL